MTKYSLFYTNLILVTLGITYLKYNPFHINNRLPNSWKTNYPICSIISRSLFLIDRYKALLMPPCIFMKYPNIFMVTLFIENINNQSIHRYDYFKTLNIPHLCYNHSPITYYKIPTVFTDIKH